MIGEPVLITSMPRRSPSVLDMATARTRLSPSCCWTSQTNTPPSSWAISMASYTSGSWPGGELSIHHRAKDGDNPTD